ncbi:hypothetical protein WA158_000728 [Blastocystis sp. Blastoise]
MIQLGLDIGTTSASVAVTDTIEKKILFTNQLKTNAYITCENPDFKEQDPYKIVSILDELIRSIPSDISSQINTMCMCGQMHGILCWTGKTHPKCITNLITWEDQRCSDELLDEIYNKYHYTLFSGYGFASLYWLKNHGYLDVSEPIYCGTIMTFYEHYLINNDIIYMDPCNAESFGFYNQVEKQWNISIYIYIYINIYFFIICTIMTSRAESLSLPLSLQMYISTGDSLAYLEGGAWRRHMNIEECLYINIGTSCQLSCLIGQSVYDAYRHTISFPSEMRYFHGNRYIYCICGMNGGNVIAWIIKKYIEDIQSIIPSIMINDKDIYYYISTHNNQTIFDEAPSIKPLLYKEREIEKIKSRNSGISILSLNDKNASFLHIYNGILKGIVDNLFSYCNNTILQQHHFSTIVITGSVLTNNQYLQEYISKQLKLPLFIEKENCVSCDGAIGASLLISQL